MPNKAQSALGFMKTNTLPFKSLSLGEISYTAEAACYIKTRRVVLWHQTAASTSPVVVDRLAHAPGPPGPGKRALIIASEGGEWPER